MPALVFAALALGAWSTRVRWLPVFVGERPANGTDGPAGDSAGSGAERTVGATDDRGIPSSDGAGRDDGPDLQGSEPDAQRPNTSGTDATVRDGLPPDAGDSNASEHVEPARGAVATVHGESQSDTSGAVAADSAADRSAAGSVASPEVADLGSPHAASASSATTIVAGAGSTAQVRELPGEGDVVHHAPAETTRTGLRRYTAPAVESVLESAAGTSGFAPAEDALRRALELAPTDGAALEALLAHLLADGRDDTALEELVRFAEEGGDPALVATRSADLDPHRDDKRALFALALDTSLELAGAALDRELWLDAAMSLDQAATFLDAARWELGHIDTERTATHTGLRQRLLRSRAAVASLALAGAPLPDDVVVGSRLAALRAERADERAVAADKAHRVTSRHARVETFHSVAVAEQASEVLEGAYARAAARLAHDPIERGAAIEVELVGEVSTFDARRLALDEPPPAWVDGFVSPLGDRMVLLDPRERGGDLERLWGLVARETTRRVLLDLAGPRRRLPAWLEWGIAVQAEGARLLADGSLDLSPAPFHRWRELAASLAGAGRSPRDAEGVLAFDGRSADGVVWAFALAAWLDAGAPGLDGLPEDVSPIDRLLAAYAAGSALAPAAALRQHALRLADGATPTLRAIQSAWSGWLSRRAALLDGDAAAIGDELDTIEALLKARQLDRAESLLLPLLAVVPAHLRARTIAYELARRQGHSDRALVCARLLGSLRATPSRSAAADERLVETLSTQHTLGQGLVDRDTRVRAAGDELVERLLADGRPLAAVRVLDRLAAAWPLDGGWLGARARVLRDVLGLDAWPITRRLLGSGSLSRLYGERELWEGTAGGLHVRCADRTEPSTLRGVVALRPPWRVSVHIAFEPVGGSLPTGPGHYVGLLFGADTPADHGQWGLLLTPSGRISLASRGHLEWPGEPIGRGPRGDCTLAVSVEGRDLSVRADGRSLGALGLGSRPPAGWMALHARGVDARLTELVLSRTRVVEPSQVWFVRAGP